MAQRPPEIPSELMEPPAASGASPVRYLAVWATMACLGSAYLAAVSVRPAFLDGYLPVAGGASSEAVERNAADIVNAREGIIQLQTDVRQVQKDLTQHADASRSLSDRVAALEQRSAPAGDAQPAASAEPQRVGAAEHQPASDVDFPVDRMPGPAEPAHPKAAAAKAPKVINAPLETGSLTEDGPAAPAAKPTPPAKPKAAAAAPKEKAEAVGSFSEPKVTKPVGIKLATGGSVDNLRVSWGVLAERHGQELSALQPRYYNNVDGNGITYELVAGPFKTTADAKRVCQSLKAQAVDCQVSTFGGNAL